jgi:hypothetical protein
MVRHIVAWSFAEGITGDEKLKNAQRIKKELEELKGMIEGIVSIQVLINPLQSSDSDLMLDSVFQDVEALNTYQTHPEHLRAAGFVRSVTTNRKCLDFNL